MRPLPVEPIAGVPSFLLGLAVIRGSVVPIVDAASLLSGKSSRPTRFVTVRAGHRRIAVAVDTVLGIRSIPSGSLAALPLLFEDALTGPSAVGTLDSELMLVVHGARLVPEHVWASIDADGLA